jgi:pimeloyl-ACP methyl ester carboxylesterase
MDTSSDLIGDLHINTCGHGPPILLIHGFGASSFTWSKIVSPLAVHYTIITLDLKGFGRSRKPQDGRYSLRDHAAAVLKVIEALGLNGLTIIGHSMGGGVALLVAMTLEQEAPRRLRRLVLIDSIACPQRVPLFLAVLRLPVLGPLVIRLVPATWSARYILNIAYFDRSKIERAFVKTYAEPLRCYSGRAALIATARALIPPDIDQLVAQYRTIRTPVLLLWGRQDCIVPLSIASRLEEAMPTASLRVLDQCGHIPQEEWPDLTSSILQEFLDELWPTQR